MKLVTDTLLHKKATHLMAKYGLLEVGNNSHWKDRKRTSVSDWRNERSHEESIHRKAPLSGLQTNARLSDSLIVWKMQIKVTMSFGFALLRLAQWKRSISPSLPGLCEKDALTCCVKTVKCDNVLKSNRIASAHI